MPADCLCCSKKETHNMENQLVTVESTNQMFGTQECNATI